MKKKEIQFLVSGFLATGILVLTFLCFWPSLEHEFVFDDLQNLFENKNYRGLNLSNIYWMMTSSYMGHYHPITWLSFAIDYSLWDLYPGGYRFTNILLHSLNGLLFYFFIIKIIKLSFSSFHNFSYIIATLGALLFSLHPLRIESVVWITERRDVLCCFFYLLTLHAYLKLNETKAYLFWYSISIFCFILSLLSKAWGITLPFILLTLDIYPLKRTQSLWGQLPLNKALILEKIPYLILSFFTGVLAILAQRDANALQSLEQYPLWERLVQSIYGISFYLSKLIIPVNLSNFYSFFKISVWIAILLFLSHLFLLEFLRRFWKKRPYLLLSYLSYIAILAPVLGLTQSGIQFVADRYTYLSCWPLILLLCGSLYCLFLKTPYRSYAVVFLFFCFLGLYTLQTLEYSKAWKNEITLWANAYEAESDNIFALERLNVSLHEARHYKESKNIAIMVLQINPDSYLGALCLAHALDHLQEYNAAISIWKRIQQIKFLPSGKPVPLSDLISASKNIGTIYKKKKEYSLAIDAFQEIVSLDPSNSDAYNFLGEIYEEKGDIDQAILFWKKAISFSPKHRSASRNLAKYQEGITD